MYYVIPVWRGQWAIKYGFWLSLCEICACTDSGHCVWVLCWCEDQELDAMGRETQGNVEIPQQASLLTFPLVYIFLYSHFHWFPHTHPCAYTHAVPPSTRFWYQQWTHCAMTSWCTTSLWLRDLSCWLDQLGQAKPQWPKEYCRNWILQCSTYSPSTSLHRYMQCIYVTMCVYVAHACTTYSWQERTNDLNFNLTKMVRICKYCTCDLCKDLSSMPFFENNAHAAVTQEIIFLGGFEAENYQDLLYMHGTCIHLY